MISYIIGGIIWYAIIIGMMYGGSMFEGVIENIIFWITFILSSFMIFRIIQEIRTFFINIYAGNKAQKQEVKEYVEKVMKEHDTNISLTDKF